MLDYIKDHIGVILVSFILFVMGILLGLLCKEDDKGIVFSANYPDNGGKLFALGRTTTSISNFNFTSFSNAESHILISKIKQLPIENNISVQLREMVKRSKGPFAKIPVNINLRFISDSNLSGPVAQACSNTPVYQNPVVAYDLQSNTNNFQKIEGIMSLHAVWEHQNLSDCELTSNNLYDVWVSKEHVESWIGPIDPQLTNLLVKANIVVSSL